MKIKKIYKTIMYILDRILIYTLWAIAILGIIFSCTKEITIINKKLWISENILKMKEKN